MPNQISITAAKKLQDKLEGVSVPLAVFSSYGSWSSTKVTTQSFKDQLRLRPHTFVGVYTVDAKLEDIAEDFEAVGVK